MSRRLPVIAFAGIFAVSAIYQYELRSRSGDAPSAGASETAWILCRRLERAHLAENCSRPGRALEHESFSIRFDPHADAPAEGAVTVFLTDRAAHADDVHFPAFSPDATPSGDDYPELYMTSHPGVGAGRWRITWTTARWEACRAARPVAVCAAQYPDEYANAKRTYDLAKGIADGG